MWFDPWDRKIPWRRAQQPTPVFLPGASHGQRGLVSCSPSDCKELDTTEADLARMRKQLGGLVLIHFPGKLQIHPLYSFIFASKDLCTHKMKTLQINFHSRNRLYLESLPFTTTFNYQMVISTQAGAEFPVLLSKLMKTQNN